MTNINIDRRTKEMRELEAEIARLGRCNEQIGKSHAEVINSLIAENTRLRLTLSRMVRLEKLCRELDLYMDGERIPAYPAAILNGIRKVLGELDFDRDGDGNKTIPTSHEGDTGVEDFGG